MYFKMKKVVIYGAGDYGKRLFTFLDAMNVKIDFFCQTLVDEEQKYVNNIPVISMQQLRLEENLKSIFQNLSRSIKSML